VLLADGPIHPATAVERARRAASLGMRAGCLVQRGKPDPAGTGAADAIEGTRHWLVQCGFADPQVVRIGEGEDRSTALLAILRRIGG
jgi:hypothetical protein